MKTSQILKVVAIALGSVLVACGSSGGGDDTTPDTGIKIIDSGLPKDGSIIIMPDSSVLGPDSSVNPGACDPIAATGCTAPMKCGAFQNAGGSLALSCGSAGTKTQGMTCTPAAAGDDCAPGLACIQITTDAMPICRAFCSQTGGPACGAGTACGLSVRNTDNTTVGPFCNAVTTCDPIAQTPCTGTDGCYIAQGGPQCAPAGTAATGAACTTANGCVKGDACLSSTCHQVCSTMGTSTCPAGAACQAVTGAGTNVGACP